MCPFWLDYNRPKSVAHLSNPIWCIMVSTTIGEHTTTKKNWWSNAELFLKICRPYTIQIGLKWENCHRFGNRSISKSVAHLADIQPTKMVDITKEHQFSARICALHWRAILLKIGGSGAPK